MLKTRKPTELSTEFKILLAYTIRLLGENTVLSTVITSSYWAESHINYLFLYPCLQTILSLLCLSYHHLQTPTSSSHVSILTPLRLYHRIYWHSKLPPSCRKNLFPAPGTKSASIIGFSLLMAACFMQNCLSSNPFLAIFTLSVCWTKWVRQNLYTNLPSLLRHKPTPVLAYAKPGSEQANTIHKKHPTPSYGNTQTASLQNLNGGG